MKLNLNSSSTCGSAITRDFSIWLRQLLWGLPRCMAVAGIGSYLYEAWDKSSLFLGLSRREQKYDAEEMVREAPNFWASISIRSFLIKIPNDFLLENV